MNNYEIVIFWSEQDRAFVADLREQPGCSAHGATAAPALANARQAIRLRLQTAKQFGDPIPKPKGRRLMLA